MVPQFLHAAYGRGLIRHIQGKNQPLMRTQHDCYLSNGTNPVGSFSHFLKTIVQSDCSGKGDCKEVADIIVG